VDATDWYKYFKCSSIDSTVLSGEAIHRIRSEEMRKLNLYKLTHQPRQALRLLRRFTRYMPLRDVIYLLVKPFLGEENRLDERGGRLAHGRATRGQERRSGHDPPRR
jgi:anaerobic magnesium-protoporphyrin IX monomethyl ester cyclase